MGRIGNCVLAAPLIHWGVQERFAFEPARKDFLDGVGPIIDNKDGHLPPWANCVMLGPTPVLLILNESDIAAREAKMFAQWKQQDLDKFYRGKV